MKTSYFLALLTIGLVGGLQSCATSPEATNQPGQTSQGKLVLTGSSTIAPLTSEIAKRYEKEHPGTRIDVQSGGSSRGVADARQGVADIGMVSRSLDPDEKDLRSFTIAKDGVSIIVNQANPVQKLTDQQIIDIYTDKINNWQQVGGKDAPITVVNKAEGRSTLELFTKHFKLDTPDIRADVVIGDNEQGIKTVAGNPNAIGYVSVGSAEFNVTQGTRIKLLPVAGVTASSANVLNGTFPISRPLNLVTSEAPTELRQDFIEFAQSPQVQDIVKEQYFVPLSK